jgi:hypothetical protein
MDNTEMDLRGVVYDSMYWIGLARDRNQWRALVDKAMNLRSP